MNAFATRGDRLRADAKMLVHEFMQASDPCQPGREGMKQSAIFRECGFDWGNRESALSSQQQYWVVALLRELEADGKVERIVKSGPWRLR